MKPEKSFRLSGTHRQISPEALQLRRAAFLNSTLANRKKPGDLVTVSEPRYAMAALETVYRQTHVDAPEKIEETELWHFAKFPEVWATEAIRRRTGFWNYRRCEQVVNRVRILYRHATPILEN